MNMSPVSRLKKTWAKVKTAKFDILEVCEADVLLLSNILYLENRIPLYDVSLDHVIRQRRKPRDPGKGKGVELEEVGKSGYGLVLS